jgi:hypothetical protein
MERTCPHCQKAFEAAEERCPHCGKESPAWTLHEGSWWEKRGDRWWVHDAASGLSRPYAGPAGVEPEALDTWVILDALREQTALLKRIAFWVTIFGILTVLATVLWLVAVVSVSNFVID